MSNGTLNYNAAIKNGTDTAVAKENNSSILVQHTNVELSTNTLEFEKDIENQIGSNNLTDK